MAKKYEQKVIDGQLYNLVPVEKRDNKPKIKQKYEHISGDGYLSSLHWNESSLNLVHLAIGNVFPVGTAKNHVRYLKIKQQIADLAGSQSWIDWKDNSQEKWYIIGWNYHNNSLIVDYVHTNQRPDTPCFQENPTELLEANISKEDLKFYCTYQKPRWEDYNEHSTN